MKALYKAGFKLCIRYIDGFIEVAETPKAAKSMLKIMLKYNRHFKDVDVIQYIKRSIKYVQNEETI